MTVSQRHYMTSLHWMNTKWQVHPGHVRFSREDTEVDASVVFELTRSERHLSSTCCGPPGDKACWSKPNSPASDPRQKYGEDPGQWWSAQCTYSICLEPFIFWCDVQAVTYGMVSQWKARFIALAEIVSILFQSRYTIWGPLWENLWSLYFINWYTGVIQSLQNQLAGYAWVHWIPIYSRRMEIGVTPAQGKEASKNRMMISSSKNVLVHDSQISWITKRQNWKFIICNPNRSLWKWKWLDEDIELRIHTALLGVLAFSQTRKGNKMSLESFGTTIFTLIQYLRYGLEMIKNQHKALKYVLTADMPYCNASGYSTQDQIPHHLSYSTRISRSLWGFPTVIN